MLLNTNPIDNQFKDNNMNPKDQLCIGGVCVARGHKLSFDLPVTNLSTHTQLTMPIQVMSGAKEGPVLFVSAAIHGDEINGVEIIYRLLKQLDVKDLTGTLIAVPIVNVHGFMQHTRYLPDRRDLNRAFPGKEKGSMTSRLAHLFMTEVVEKCTHGIDLHTGSNHRTNLPQIRASFTNKETKKLAKAFGAPVVIESSLREGSLRHAVETLGIPVLLYEAGEALRFDETSITIGVRGILSVMHTIGMLQKPQQVTEPIIASTSTWVRAPESGILRSHIKLGSRIEKGQVIAIVGDSFGENEVAIKSPKTGLVIGCTSLPLVNEGEALYHIIPTQDKDNVEEVWEEFQADIEYWNHYCTESNPEQDAH